MTKSLSSDALSFDRPVKKMTVRADGHDVRLNLPVVGAVLFCAGAWAGVAYLVLHLINH
ncbi:hypothetical protein [Asticcacaulis sp. 201]|uniref:hypothetical protein n=1 Tax=Asticcacaulis sp. 201 TaxID=3028787 RepID=UPI0029169CE2|nr:hypothetical protein [Asticcacaulis sp. 201]MDV6331419.1 hypothetical protein [Asticcacaulis sp. 201]